MHEGEWDGSRQEYVQRADQGVCLECASSVYCPMVVSCGPYLGYTPNTRIWGRVTGVVNLGKVPNGECPNVGYNGTRPECGVMGWKVATVAMGVTVSTVSTVPAVEANSVASLSFLVGPRKVTNCRHPGHEATTHQFHKVVPPLTTIHQLHKAMPPLHATTHHATPLKPKHQPTHPHHHNHITTPTSPHTHTTTHPHHPGSPFR